MTRERFALVRTSAIRTIVNRCEKVSRLFAAKISHLLVT